MAAMQAAEPGVRYTDIVKHAGRRASIRDRRRGLVVVPSPLVLQQIVGPRIFTR